MLYIEEKLFKDIIGEETMPNQTTHLVAGAVSSLIVAMFDKNDNHETVHDPFLAAAIGAVSGRLPDILEPALRNPHHRQFFHSVVVLVAVGYGLKRVYEWKPEDNLEALVRGVLLFAGAGYVSHLLLDAATARSLPIIGKI